MNTRKFKDTVLAPTAIVVGLVVLWEAVCRVFAIAPTILPPPSMIWSALVQFWDPIVSNGWQTLFTTLVGFGLAIVCGLALGGSSSAGRRRSMARSTR